MTILITGANRGIGKGLADEWREAGEHVIGTARSEPGMEVLDVADPASVTASKTNRSQPWSVTPAFCLIAMNSWKAAIRQNSGRSTSRSM